MTPVFKIEVFTLHFYDSLGVRNTMYTNSRLEALEAKAHLECQGAVVWLDHEEDKRKRPRKAKAMRASA